LIDASGPLVQQTVNTDALTHYRQIETERLVIASPPLPKAQTSATPSADGKRWTTPPVYSLQINYTRKTNKGKSLLRQAKKSITLGHMGEWFTEEGEFVESIFEKKLIAGLEEAFEQ
jgi:signal peptidase complex subunit 2